MFTPSTFPDDAQAVADFPPVNLPARNRRAMPHTFVATLDWWRVGLLALVATAHIVGLGLLALPNADPMPTEPIQRRISEALDSDRLTLFVDLEPAPAPPLQPLPPPPVRLVVPPATAPVPQPASPAAAPAVVTDTPTPVSIPLTTPAAAAPQAEVAPAATAESVASAAPSRPRGDPAQIRNDRDAYMRALMAALLQHRSYPPEARKQRARGTVHVRFSVDRNGHVLSSSIARGAGYPILEAAALEVLRSADPLPPIPESLGVDRLTVTVPIEYSLITR